jgi:hypothetical protein
MASLSDAIVATFGNEHFQLGDRLAISEASPRQKKTRLQLGVKLGGLGEKNRHVRREIRRYQVPFLTLP